MKSKLRKTLGEASQDRSSLNTKSLSKKAKQAKPAKQQDMFPKSEKAYGGSLRNTRKGRQGARALTTSGTIHLVLRSTKAKGSWSFTLAKNKNLIRATLKKYAQRNFIKIISVANVGNHLHIHLKLTHQHYYKSFIRSIAGVIALKIMKAGPNAAKVKCHKDRFWDYRPFTRIITSFRHFVNTQDYIAINQFEGIGIDRLTSQMIVRQNRDIYSASG
jgi:REP element-mobilizing transposase RayT